MKNLGKIGIIFLFCILATAAFSQAKIGFVNTEKILEEAPQAQGVRERLEREFSRREKDILAAEERAKALQTRLDRDGPTMKESERVLLERDINRYIRELRVMEAEFQEDLNIRRNEELLKLQKTISDTIADYARRERFDLILTDGVFFASDSVDISDAVIRLLTSGR